MRSIVVEDEVDVEGRIGRRLDAVEKTQELLMPVFGMALSDDSAFEHVQRGEQCGSSMTLVVMRLSFR